MAALHAGAWDLREELAALPDADRSAAAPAQRAAAVSFCLALAAGWRDVAALAKRYARWGWMRRAPAPEEQLVSSPKLLSFVQKLTIFLHSVAPEVQLVSGHGECCFLCQRFTMLFWKRRSS